MNKIYHRSIRYTEEVKNIIEDYDGKSFSNKFENLVLRAKKNRLKKIYEIKKLDEEIKNKINILNQLNIYFNKIKNIIEKI